ncbi:TonB-dependent receptor [Gemmatirosa kalamazoonensis]|uniref:TonB-dependent receptor n=1 Tax=Gemmatirosa kalamazoonensis TaxID=861299 RepID=W0RJL7_9BACT|nr:TonB-dependent receptor [Gemmatirosa kalamazoonensis]AHG90535.1 TonB-dependent receptor [Gemmatirosa kalamazoonensis]
MHLHVTRLLLAGSLVLAAERAAAQQPALGTVTGRVTGESGEGMVGATIAVTGTPYGALTKSDGTYRIALRPGTYELRARLIGYTSPRDTVVVTAGGTVTRNFRLARAASTLEAVAVVGSRTEARTVIESPVPVDVLSAAEIKSTGRTETAQILQQLAPSVNFPRPSITDGTDHVRPLTLRGLGADQVLVLLNGKRRHTSALVNLNGSVGRGQAAVDVNAIPASMIDHIEVLRDGAAAQYGSDAIAGVVNIVLKSGADGNLTAEYGRTATTYGGQTVNGTNLVSGVATPVTAQTPSRSAHDGGLVHAALDKGVASSQSRFLHGGVEYRNRGNTNRTLADPRPQTFAEVTNGTFRDLSTGPMNYELGDAAVADAVGMFNGGYDLANGVELYAFGGFDHREGRSAGNFRRVTQNTQTVRSIYPNGFLPFIESTIGDFSGFGGARGKVAGWQWDLSTGYGRDNFRFDVTHSNNASMGAASPTNFYAGTLVFGQWMNNLDLSREVHVGTAGIPLRLAAGAEFRVDQYRIKAGDVASYVDGGAPVLDANGNVVVGAKAIPGAQVFPGFQPSNAVDASRNNAAVYADVESDITKQFLVSGAVRYEHYSDFGSTTTGKVASRLTIVPGFVLRGAFGTGFRAPSLQQTYFSSTATNFVNGVPFEIRTAPVGSDLAKVLGAKPLKPEHSTNYSAGVALEPARSLSFTVDLYRVNITDRIVLSENFTGTAVQNLLRPLGVSGARYFTNAIDTRTNGIDVVGNYGLSLRSAGFVRLMAGYNHNKTHATLVAQTPPELGNQNENLFGRVERARIEEGQPRDNFLASANYEYHDLGLVARTQRFGSVTTRATVGSDNLDQTFGAKWITDVSASYKVLRRFTLTAGADNVFDVYPDQNNNLGNVRSNVAGNANFGIFPYSSFSPFGFNGRFVYARVGVGI